MSRCSVEDLLCNYGGDVAESAVTREMALKEAKSDGRDGRLGQGPPSAPRRPTGPQRRREITLEEDKNQRSDEGEGSERSWGRADKGDPQRGAEERSEVPRKDGESRSEGKHRVFNHLRKTTGT